MLHPRDAAQQFIEENFRDCQAAILAGSVVRGEATATSDLDIIIITSCTQAPYRESQYRNGWPVETFVHTEKSFYEYARRDLERRRPSLPLMASEGLILKDEDGLAISLKNYSLGILQGGVKPLSREELGQCRYEITELLDDLIGSPHPEQDYFIINELIIAMGNLILVCNGEWKARGKWVARALKNLDEVLYREMIKSLQAFYRQGDKKKLLAFIEKELKRCGGRLFAGFHSGNYG